MDGVVRWFERRGEVPLAPPPHVREYGSLTEDPDKFGGGYTTAGVRGVAFAMEYLDLRGWTSVRTIRCLGVDTRKPASLTAFCHVRQKVSRFRIDRIITVMEFRTGRVLSVDEQNMLLAPYLNQHDPEPCVRALLDLQDATRDGVFALLQLAMEDGRLDDQERDIVLEYVTQETRARAIPLPAFELLELWIDNLAPQLDVVRGAVERLLEDKHRFARLLPFVMRIVRGQPAFPRPEEALRELIGAVRTYYRHAPRDWPDPVLASS